MRTLKNILRVIASNIFSIIGGVVIGFVVPKLLSVDDYGNYKTFTLYLSYVGLCSLGFVDGIVLKFGGNNYDQLNRSNFRGYFKFYMILHLLFSGVIIAFSCILSNTDKRIICLLLALDMIASNIIGYFQQISQFTQRFNEYSIRKIIQSCLEIFLVASLFVFSRYGYSIDYVIYTCSIIFIHFILVAWYIFTYKDIVFGKSIKIKSIKSDIKALIFSGFPLLLANLCSTLILSLDRQFVNVFFSNHEYAIYSFAYSMLSLVTVATSAISTVLFPLLKRMEKKDYVKNYDLVLTMLTLIVFGLVAIYYPLGIFIDWFLPKYHNSMSIFRIIIPGLSVSSAITVIMHNYYKVLGWNKKYFKKSIVVLGVSAITNTIALLFFKSMEAISIASVLTMIFWYIYANNGLKKECKSFVIKNISYIILMLLVFYGVSAIDNYWIALVLYFTIFVCISFVFYNKNAKKFISIIQ